PFGPWRPQSPHVCLYSESPQRLSQAARCANLARCNSQTRRPVPMSEKPWIAHYPDGVPAEIDVNEFRSVVDVFDKSCDEFRHKPAYVNFGTTLSFDQLDQYSATFAAALKDLGLGKGDRIAIMMPNVLQYPIAVFGALRAGLAVVNTNPLYTARELKHQLTDSGSIAIVISDNCASVLEAIVDDVDTEQIIITRMGDMLGPVKGALMNFVLRHIKKMVPRYDLPNSLSFKSMLRENAGADRQPVELNHDDMAFLQYTGGTTGVSKGAILTHGNMVANLQQASAWLGGQMRLGEEVIITALPLYHVFALTANCLVFIKIGGKNILITNPRDMPGFVKTLS